MKPKFESRDLRAAAMGHLGFTPEDAKALRAGTNSSQSEEPCALPAAGLTWRRKSKQGDLEGSRIWFEEGAKAKREKEAALGVMLQKNNPTSR
jgi:hypothetical protein